jgi:2-dehydro-3-deoxyphosphogluconate aldolase / (4S)-4-hydroxy-2-oxoglutarate aldolase
MVKKEEVCARIKEIGILPAIRVPSSEDALFAAGEMLKWGIPVVELTMTVPGAIGVITELARTAPQLIVGAGTVLDIETARACLEAGAAFVTSPGLDAKIVDFAVKHNVAAIPGVLTPTEVIMAHSAGADLVKIFPCAAVGGPGYLRALRSPFPHVPFIASGGVDQATATGYIRAGAVALGIRGELIPPEAVQRRDQNWIHELASRFLAIVQRARTELGAI